MALHQFQMSVKKMELSNFHLVVLLLVCQLLCWFSNIQARVSSSFILSAFPRIPLFGPLGTWPTRRASACRPRRTSSHPHARVNFQVPEPGTPSRLVPSLSTPSPTPLRATVALTTPSHASDRARASLVTPPPIYNLHSSRPHSPISSHFPSTTRNKNRASSSSY